jgi:hypothetical protein
MKQPNRHRFKLPDFGIQQQQNHTIFFSKLLVTRSFLKEYSRFHES